MTAREEPRGLEALLEGHGSKPLLRFNTCGSVDDGKSTLIGRLLYETKALFDDQLATLETDAPVTWTTRFCSMGSPRSASRASPSTLRTVSSRRRADTSSSPTHLATNNTRATWSPAPRPPI
jgi:hypothetical protein